MVFVFNFKAGRKCSARHPGLFRAEGAIETIWDSLYWICSQAREITAARATACNRPRSVLSLVQQYVDMTILSCLCRHCVVLSFLGYHPMLRPIRFDLRESKSYFACETDDIAIYAPACPQGVPTSFMTRCAAHVFH